MIPALTAVAGLVLGFVAGFLYRKSVSASNALSIEARAQTLLLDSQRQADAAAQQTLQEAKDEVASMRREAEDDLRGRRDELARQERRMDDADEELKAKIAKAETRATELAEREDKLTYIRTQLERANELHVARMEKIAGMTSGEARDQLAVQIVDDAKRVAMSQVREIEQRAREEGEERARKIVTIAIQRVASEQTASCRGPVTPTPEVASSTRTGTYSFSPGSARR